MRYNNDRILFFGFYRLCFIAMFKYLFGCFRPDFPSRNIHPNTPTPVPRPIPSPAPPATVVETKPTPTPARTICSLEALKTREAQLRNRIEVLEKQIAELRKTAKAYKLEGKTNHALLCLKKSKMFENSVSL